MWQAGLAPELARVGFQQLRQEDNIPVTASYLAAPELPLVATLQHLDLWATWRQELSSAQLGSEHSTPRVKPPIVLLS